MKPLLFCLLLLVPTHFALSRDFRPKWHFENISLADSSVQQCYVIEMTPGVHYTFEVSDNLGQWTPLEELYGLGGQYAVAMREFTPAPTPPPGTPPASPPAVATSVSLRIQPASGAAGGSVVSWRSLDHGGPVIVRISGEMDEEWNSIPIFWNQYGTYNFYFWHPGTPITPPEENPPLGIKDSAMLAVLEASVPEINQQIAASILRARNAPPPAPPDPNSRRFWRVKVDWGLDTDHDGSLDWAEYEIAARGTGTVAPGVFADAFNADTNNDGITDGGQLDTDSDGKPDAQDSAPGDDTATFPIGPLPRYAMFPITNAQPAEWTNSYQISDKGTVLYQNGTWTAGTWTPLATPGLGQAVFARGINDHNQIIGWSGRAMPNQAEPAEAICFWNSPNAPLSWATIGEGTSERYAGVPSEGFRWAYLTPGPVLSNDGHFSAFTWSKAANGMYDLSRTGYWKLPSGSGALSEVAGDHRWDYHQEPSLKWGAGYPLHSPDQGTIENQEDSSQPLERVLLAPGALPSLSFTPTNLLAYPESPIIALPGVYDDKSGMALIDGAWKPTETYSSAIDIAADGTAIGKGAEGLAAPICLNGKWTGIKRTAPMEIDGFDPPSPWHAETVTLWDTTPGGWILAQKGPYAEDDRAVMLPIRAEGHYTASDGATLIRAVGVDDFSIGSDSPGAPVQERIWIMAPQGGFNKIVKFKAPLNSNTPLNFSAPNILFGSQDNVTITGAVSPVTLRAADTVLSGGERLMSLTLGSGNAEVPSISKPIGLKIMKGRTVKVTVYKVTKLFGANAEQPVDAIMMPTEDEIDNHLEDVFRPQINVEFDVNLEPVPLRARWNADNDASFDIQIGAGDPEEEAAILAEIPANPAAYDIRVFLVANSAPLSSGIDSYGLTIRDQRTCWVLGSKFGKNRNKPHLLDTIAHEIGHVFVGDGHPDKNNGPAPLPGTRHICRLMCSGPSSDGSSRLLVKGEWDEAEKWLKAIPDKRVFDSTGSTGSY